MPSRSKETQGANGMIAKSVDTQSSQEKGNTEPSKRRWSLGVCNEWMLSPEGKVHSELCRNAQRRAEMIRPA